MYYQRNLQSILMQRMGNEEAIFILGPRQSGKTTLLKQLMQQVGEENSIYIDIEYPQNLALLNQSFASVLQYLRKNRSNNPHKTFVFIDEIQYLTDFSKNVKLLVDHHSNEFKLVMTGSSSVMIRQQFQESLVGRKEVYELYPLTFREFCLFKEEAELVDLLGIAAADNSINSIQYLIPKLESLLQEYIIFGGYPKVVISENQEEKIRILQDITSSYILKDIRNLFRIEKIDNLNHLIRFLSVNIGKELNIHTLSVDTGLHRETVINYLNILEASYIIKRLSPFHTNLGTELKKMPKVYFVDTGIRNILLENLNPLEIRTDKGELLENYVFNALLHQKDLLTQLNYWKTRNKQEVDFVLSNANSIKAYEVKYGSNKTNSFQTFRVSYPQAICQYIRFAIQDEDVKSVPAWLL